MPTPKPMQAKGTAMTTDPIRLSQLSHGGGCGCKLAPAVLRELLAGQAAAQAFPQLLVGTETADDAAVWQVSDDLAVIATTDFFMPMVDDPHAFGRIAATNAISDIYAMGGRPIMALAILGMPIDKLPAAMIREILEGGRAICAEAGIPVAGGHSIDSPEPIYGLAVIGLVHPARLRRNADAKPGDALILTKGLWVGIYSAAIKKSALDEAGIAEMIASTTLLNKVGADLAADPAVHAITDVTGFGILGQVRPDPVQKRGRGDHLVDAGLVQRVLLDRRRIMPDPQSLGQDQRIAHPRVRIAAQLRRIDQPDHGQPVDRLDRVDGMAAGDRDPRLGADRLPALQDQADRFGRQPVHRHPKDRQRHDRPPAHRVDVGNRVRPGDAPEGVGVVHHRHEEVGRGDHRRAIVDLPDGGVVGGLVPDQQLREHLPHRLARKQVAQHGGGKLAAAATAVGKLGQADRGGGGWGGHGGHPASLRLWV